jgi:hypothetical protein
MGEDIRVGAVEIRPFGRRDDEFESVPAAFQRVYPGRSASSGYKSSNKPLEENIPKRFQLIFFQMIAY